VVCLVHLALYRGGRIPALPVALWLIFLGWAGLSTFWAIDQKLGWQQFQVAAPLIVLLLAAATVPADEVDLDVLRLSMIVGGIIVGAYAFILLVAGTALPEHGTGGTERFSLTGTGETNPNILAASLLLPLVLSVERILLGGSRWWGPGTWRFLGMAGAFFMVLALLLTGSRGGLIAAAIGFSLTLMYAGRLPAARPWIRRTILAVAAIALSGPTAFAVARLFGGGDQGPDIRAIPAIQRIVDPETGSSGRAQIWTAGLTACRVHCAVGAGLDNFSAAFDQTYAFSAASKNLERGQAAHNVYLAVAVEGGLVGLTLFFLALLAEWRALRAPYLASKTPAFRAALVGLLAANFFLSALWFKYFWLLFILIRVAEPALQERERMPPGLPVGPPPRGELQVTP
jgi:O-antigen ligase